MSAIKLSTLLVVLPIINMLLVAVAGNEQTYKLHIDRIDVETNTTTVEDISYSGSLDKIIAMAQKMADQDTQAPSFAPPSTPAPGPTSSPVDIPIGGTTTSPTGYQPTTILGCADASSEVERITYSYAIETLAGTEIAGVQEILEWSLNADLASSLLSCEPSGRFLRRNLQTVDVGIVAFDSLPKDEPVENAFCSSKISASNTCTVIDGVMTVFFNKGANEDMIRYQVRLATRDFLNQASDIPGLVASVYLGPGIVNPSDPSNAEGGESSSTAASSGGNMGTSGVVLAACGGLAVLGAVGTALYLRRPRSSEPPPKSLNQDNTLGVNTTDCDSVTGETALSPFSSMLPSAYRFDQDMSIILESDDGGSVAQSSDILMSEGWTTEDDSSTDHINSSRVSATPVLGARKRKEEENH